MIFLLILLFIVITITMIVRAQRWAMGGAEPWDCTKLIYRPYYNRTVDVDHSPPDFRWTKFPQESQLALKQGQRKLLMTEIEFYTQCFKEHIKVAVYAGAAPGHHHALIAQLFPTKRFILYDPNPFYEGLHKYENIEIHQEYFTAHHCEQLRKQWGDHFIFLSDIRTGPTDDNVAMDMKLQEEWCTILQPQWAMLKFRLPLSGPNIDYYDGDVYLQPRCGATSRETRLWTDCRSRRQWTPSTYTDALLYWQRQQRHAWHEITNYNSYIPGMDHCYDCWAEHHILQGYLNAHETTYTMERLFQAITAFTFQPLNVAPHGIYPDERDSCRRILALRPYVLKFKDDRRALWKINVVKNEDSMWTTKNLLYLPLRPRMIHTDMRPTTTRVPEDPAYRPHYDITIQGIPTAPIQSMLSSPNLGHPVRSIMILLVEWITRHHCDQIILVTNTFSYTFNQFARLFPKIRFIFWTTASPYKSALEPNLTVVNKILSLEDAATIPKNSFLFIDYYVDCSKASELVELAKVYRQWIDIIQPCRALLAYRWTPEFYEGDIILPPYNISRPREYLIVDTDCRRWVPYNAVHLRHQFEYWKCYIVPAFHEHQYPLLPESTMLIEDLTQGGLDHCYYCWRETRAWQAAFPDRTALQISELVLNGWCAGPATPFNFLHFKPHGMLPMERNTAQRLTRLQFIIADTNQYIEWVNNNPGELARRSNVPSWTEFRETFSRH